MSEIEHEIVDQPRAWTLAAKLGRDGRASLPAPGSRACVVGCGTSYYIAEAYAAYRESAGLGKRTRSRPPRPLRAAATTT